MLQLWGKAVHGGLVTLVICILALISFVAVVGEQKSQWAAGLRKREVGSWDRSFGGIVTTETADAIQNDVLLRRNLLSLLDMTADVMHSLAKKGTEEAEFKEASDILNAYRQRLAQGVGANEKRAPQSLGDLLGGGEGGGGGALASLLKPITDAVGGALGGLGNSLLSDLQGPATFLGIGVGAGAAQGLKLASADETAKVAKKVAADNKMQATGLNPSIQSLGMGATASLLGAVNISALAGGFQLQPAALALAEGIGNGTASGLKLNAAVANMVPATDSSIPGVVGTFGFGLSKTIASNLNVTGLSLSSLQGLAGDTPLSQMALSLSEGIGNGAAMGLQLTKNNLTPPPGNTVNDAVGSFGFGLTNSITKNINASALLPQGTGINSVIPMLGGAALSLGEGIGNGAATGLKLTNAQLAPNPLGSSIPEVVGNFGFGLSKAVTQNLDTAQLLNSANAGSMLTQMLPAAAAGLGKGLGEGIPVGLGLQPDTPVQLKVMPDGSIDAGGVAQNFGKGLTAGLLANGTVSKLAAGAGGIGLPSNLDIGRIAQGFGRGMLQGAGDTVQSMGGVQALLNGTAKLPAGGLPVSRVDFDDSIGGAATGFGVGLGGQGVVVAQLLISNPNGAPALAPTPAVASPPQLAAAPTATTSLVPVPVPALRRKSEEGNLDRRQIVSVDDRNGFNLSVIINAQTVSTAAQAGVDALTCQGVGGLALIVSGLLRSKTISSDSLRGGGGVPDTIKQIVPTGTISITNEGNTYEIDGQKVTEGLTEPGSGVGQGVRINGTQLTTWIALLAVHIVFGIIAFLNVVPLAIGLESAQNILHRVNIRHVLPGIPKWNNIMWLFVIAPSLIIVLVLGILVMGNGQHFRSVHGIFSLLATIVGFAAVALHFVVKVRASSPAGAITPSAKKPTLYHVRTAVNQVLLALASASALTGFKGFSSMALCFTSIVPLDLAISIGFGLATVFILGSSISGLDAFLDFRDSRKKKAGENASDLKIGKPVQAS